ncbi:ribonuclease Y [Propionibacteriaceae bacterium G1746]|uniref:ribonuclease Y n=1 Tax=Aestuariimicrobium sp. G57 TaxID=3418485 RepID=UPI003C1C11A3
MSDAVWTAIVVVLAVGLVALGAALWRLRRSVPSAGQWRSEQADTLSRIAAERDALASDAHGLATTSGSLDARASALDQRAAEVDQREAALASQTEALRQTRTELDEAGRQERNALRDLHDQLNRRDAVLTQREQRVEQLTAEQRARDKQLGDREQELVVGEQALTVRLGSVDAELERIASLSAEDARTEVLARAEHDARLASARVIRDIERDTKREADAIARSVIVTSIQRLAADQAADAVITAVHLPSEEMKGRIIGREGRNIRTFEQVTGVNVMIDDTPETVLLSSFDPVRREVARVTLEALVADGRIQPGRIEEVHERSLAQVSERSQRAAEDALAEVGITDLAPDLVPVVGALKYRTSYGQNVLQHSLETAHLANLMAHELGLDAATATRAGFLHDIGKALTHEVEGPHAEIGADLCRRHGEHEDVVHAIAAHHNEIEPRTVEALLVQAADAISGSRPGARRESLEAHVRRLTRLEEIAMDQPGVDRAFAMQAGRELRIMVLPELVDDLGSQAIARDVARTIEEELTYPGQIRVTVVRESRATQTAH